MYEITYANGMSNFQYIDDSTDTWHYIELALWKSVTCAKMDKPMGLINPPGLRIQLCADVGEYSSCVAELYNLHQR